MVLEREWLAPPVEWTLRAEDPEVSRPDVAVFLARGTARRWRTLMTSRYSLPPGHAVQLVSNGPPTLERRWSSLGGGELHLLSMEHRAAELRRRVEDSLLTFVRGKRVGLLLSGGYDSTLLASLMARAKTHVRCYTVEAPGRYPSEWSHALETAKRLNLPIKKVVVTLGDLLLSTATMQKLKSSPNVCWVIANQLAASQAAREDDCEVLVLGTGSDELFGPASGEVEKIRMFKDYADHLGDDKAWKVLLGRPCADRTALLHRGNINPFTPSHLRQLFPDLDVPILIEDDIVELYRELHSLYPKAPYESLTLQLELEMRSSDIIMHELRTASMVHSMEVYFPFYDKRIVELAAGTPISEKIHQVGQGSQLLGVQGTEGSAIISKYLLRYAFADVLPLNVHKRPRLAYTLPFSWWMRGVERKDLMECIESSTIWDQLRIDPEVLRRFSREPLDEGTMWEAPFRFWLLYQLSVWQQR